MNLNSYMNEYERAIMEFKSDITEAKVKFDDRISKAHEDFVQDEEKRRD